MLIFSELKEQLMQLSEVLSKIEDEQYVRPIVHLGGSTIGQHTRHIIELLNCALKGKSEGVVDYVNRTRDLSLENDRSKALASIALLTPMLKGEDVSLNLITTLQNDAEQSMVQTTFFREIVYNAEHATHHLALIKVALIEMELQIFDDRFGYAYSTLQYKASFSPQS